MKSVPRTNTINYRNNSIVPYECLEVLQLIYIIEKGCFETKHPLLFTYCVRHALLKKINNKGIKIINSWGVEYPFPDMDAYGVKW